MIRTKRRSKLPTANLTPFTEKKSDVGNKTSRKNVYPDASPKNAPEIAMNAYTFTRITLLSAALAACSAYATRPTMVSEGMLTGGNGMTLLIRPDEV